MRNQKLWQRSKLNFRFTHILGFSSTRNRLHVTLEKPLVLPSLAFRVFNFKYFKKKFNFPGTGKLSPIKPFKSMTQYWNDP